MKQGDKLILTIIDYGSNGEGIAKQDGYVIFVPFTIVGEQVKVRITYVKKNFANAVLEQVIVASQYRVEPPCNRYMKCGGCDLLHMQYDEQLKLKRNAVQNTFAKNYKGELLIDEVQPSTQILAYRNKFSLPFGIKNGKVAVGFYKENTHDIVSITKCFLQGEWIEPIISSVLDYANTLKLSVYDCESGKGLLRHLVARKIGSYISITLVSTSQLPKLHLLVQRLSASLPMYEYALYLNINKSKGNTILKGDAVFVAGNEKLVAVRDIMLNINPMSFLQVNNDIRDKIYDRVQALITAKPGTVVIDAYAGMGILGGNLAKKGIKVFNLEIVPQAVENANTLTKINGLDNYVTSVCGDSAVELPKLVNKLKTDVEQCAIHSMKLNQPYFDKIKFGEKLFELRLNDAKRQKIKVGDTICFTENGGTQKMLCAVTNRFEYKDFNELFAELGTSTTGFGADLITTQAAAKIMSEFYSDDDIKQYGTLALQVKPVTPSITVVLDPPRKGCDVAVLQALKSLPLDQIIYISCNPATLSRDINILSDRFVTQFVTPYDMFPNTRHLECLCVLKQRSCTN